jgi:hypothetical protein
MRVATQADIRERHQEHDYWHERSQPGQREMTRRVKGFD